MKSDSTASEAGSVTGSATLSSGVSAVVIAAGLTDVPRTVAPPIGFSEALGVFKTAYIETSGIAVFDNAVGAAVAGERSCVLIAGSC